MARLSPLRLLPGPTGWNYLPYGTRTLKFRVDALPGAHLAWLRPLQRHPNPNLIAGHEDSGDDLLITWSGGDKRGYRLDFSAGDRYAYFHVTHRVAELPGRYDITLILETDAGEVCRQVVRLGRPQAKEPLRTIWQAVDSNLSQITFTGRELPAYQSRWWPRPAIRYCALETTPPIHIEYQRAVDGVFGAIRVLWRGEPLVGVSGHLDVALHDARLFAATLFDFGDKRHWVLRLWFQWLYTHLTPLDVAGTAAPQATPAISERCLAEATRLNELLDRGEREEIPDVERFDLVIDTLSGRVVFAGTDLHWQELWGPTPNILPLPAEILSLGLKNIAYSVALYLRTSRERLTRPPRYDPAAVLRDRIARGFGEAERALIPPVVTRLPLILQYHTPFIGGLHFDSDLISGDVRRAREFQQPIWSESLQVES